MLCPHCGSYAGENDILCPGCGALLDKGKQLGEGGVRSIRQGRKGSKATVQDTRPAAGKRGASRIYVDPAVGQNTREIPMYGDGVAYQAPSQPSEATFDRPRRMVYSETAREQTVNVRAPRRRLHHVTKHMVNWSHVMIAASVAVVLLGIGGFLYLRNTHDGQKIMVRLGQASTAAARWQVGEEALDTGAIDQAITLFEQAREQEGQESVDVDNLLLLGSAYEAAGRVAEAEALYTDIYTSITPSAPDAYRAVIRIMLADGRRPQAAELMSLAYEKTGLATFRNQRTELLPIAPVSDLMAGYYEQKKTVTLSSPQGYDIYYIINSPDGVLPQDGERYTEPLFLDEGTWELRAVCVSGDLVSDQLAVTYSVYMPSPLAPRSSLAPGTYKQRQRIWIKPGKLSDEAAAKSTRTAPETEEEKDLTFYYTIDGSQPDADSPVYTGEPFYLPSGSVKLRIIAVNGYGKPSNTTEVSYKIGAGKNPGKAYSVTEDAVNGLTLNITTREEFQNVYGQGDGVEEVYLQGYAEACQKYSYPWGYAVMGKIHTGWVLAELCFTDTTFKAPRSTGIGSSEESIVNAFRDMGQLESPSGNRGLYEYEKGKGKIYVQEDGGKLIRYTAETADGHIWQLDYRLNSAGVAVSIDMLYIP